MKNIRALEVYLSLDIIICQSLQSLERYRFILFTFYPWNLFEFRRFYRYL